MNKGPTIPIPPPPKTDKGRQKQAYQSATIEDLQEEDGTPQPQNQQKEYQRTPFPHKEPPRMQTRYGLYEGDESLAAIPRRGLKIIKNPTLTFDRANFTFFLKQYKQDAVLFWLNNFEMAMQIGQFVKTEELKREFEAMDG